MLPTAHTTRTAKYPYMQLSSEDPSKFPTDIFDYAKGGLLNFVGSCCGIFPYHITAVIENVLVVHHAQYQNCPSSLP